MPAVFPPCCRSSSAKCFLFGHHFLSKRNLDIFLNQLIQFYLNNATNLRHFNYAQYDGVDLQNGDRIATTYLWRHFTLCILKLSRVHIHTGVHVMMCWCCSVDPVPMRMRALPQSMWQEPNVPHNVSPATVYPVLPPLVTREGDDITGSWRTSSFGRIYVHWVINSSILEAVVKAGSLSFVRPCRTWITRYYHRFLIHWLWRRRDVELPFSLSQMLIPCVLMLRFILYVVVYATEQFSRICIQLLKPLNRCPSVCLSALYSPMHRVTRDSDVISSYHIYASCLWGKLCETFVILTSLS